MRCFYAYNWNSDYKIELGQIYLAFQEHVQLEDKENMKSSKRKQGHCAVFFFFLNHGYKQALHGGEGIQTAEAMLISTLSKIIKILMPWGLLH